MKQQRGIAFKLILLILSSVTLIFLAIFGYNYLYTRQIIKRNIEENAHNLAGSTANRINEVLSAVEKVPQNLAYALEATSCRRTEINDMLRAIVKNNPEIYGATMAFEPYMYEPGTLAYAPYFYKNDGRIEYSDLGALSYRYFNWDWYQIPKELNSPVWSEPYYDEGGGNIIMSTYSVPFYMTVDGRRQFAGIITADISLSWLQQIMRSIRIAETGYGFLLSRNGTFVTHPNDYYIMNETIFSVAEANNDQSLRKLGRKMIQGQRGFVPFGSLVTGKECWMVYAPLRSGWSIGVLFPQNELMADITNLNRLVLGIGIAGFFFLFFVIIFIAHSITRPLRVLAGATRHIADGDLDSPIPEVVSRDEVGALAESFALMKDSLKQYIIDLTAATAAKERIESELHIAHDIQMGILPKVFPPFPDLKEFDIYATLEPAREVGGDLYDFFFLDDDHLCFNLGDVSGKGIPASLFMAITKTLIKTKATKPLTAEQVVNQVNRDLSIDNPSLMFVTLFLGILNIHTGELRYCNGGHNRPYIIRAGGRIEMMETTQGIALGVMEDFSFQSRTVRLDVGDTLFVYSDGVTEAMNEEKELFSEKRLEQGLELLKDRPVEELIAGIMERVNEFCGNEPQADDITMLAIRFNGD